MSAEHLTLPADRFYWALLDVGALPARHRRDPRALGFLFENTLPVPIEDAHAAYLPLDAARTVACGMAVDDMRAFAAEHPDALTLAPESVPAFLAEESVDSRRLNVLSGPFEPPTVRRSKRHLLAQAVLTVITFGVITFVGLERRVHMLQVQAADLRSARLAAIERAVGSGSSGSNAQPPELRFLAELRTLRQTRVANAGDASSSSTSIADVAPTLASLLAHWPADLHVLTESVSLTPTSLTLRASAPSSDDVQRLANVLSVVGGDGSLAGGGAWRSEQPQINASSEGQVSATLQWKREPPSPAPRGGGT